MKSYVLDTNTLIYALEKGSKIIQHRYLISVITELELLSYSKLTDEEEVALRALLKNFKCIGLTNKVKLETIKIRKQYKIKLPDSIIVATAIANDAILVTSDRQLLKLDIVQSIELKALL